MDKTPAIASQCFSTLSDDGVLTGYQKIPSSQPFFFRVITGTSPLVIESPCAVTLRIRLDSFVASTIFPGCSGSCQKITFLRTLLLASTSALLSTLTSCLIDGSTFKAPARFRNAASLLENFPDVTALACPLRPELRSKILRASVVGVVSCGLAAPGLGGRKPYCGGDTQRCPRNNCKFVRCLLRQPNDFLRTFTPTETDSAND